jgi:hypothetical protein
MASWKLFSLPNGSIVLSKVTATYFIVVYHLSFVVECEEVVVAITSYTTRIVIAILSKYF